MFNIGQSVRLNKGWTEMIVIAVDNRGVITAKYHEASEEDFNNPWQALSTQKRHQSGFTAWDGDTSLKPGQKTGMGRRYRTKTKSPMEGVYLNKTTSGHMVLEMDDGNIQAFKPNKLVEVLPVVVSVRQVTALNNYVKYFRLTKEQENLSIKPGSLLVSDDDELYVVRAIHPKFNLTGHEKIFQGTYVPTLPFK